MYSTCKLHWNVTLQDNNNYKRMIYELYQYEHSASLPLFPVSIVTHLYQIVAYLY